MARICSVKHVNFKECKLTWLSTPRNIYYFFINILSEHSGWHLLQDTSLMKLCSTMTWFLSTFLFRLLWLSYPLPFFHLCASLSVYRLRVPMVPSVVPPSVCLVVRLLLRQPLWYSRMSLPLFCLSSCHLKRSPSVGPASKGRRVSTITALCELCALLSRFVFVCACAVAVRWHDVKYSSSLYLNDSGFLCFCAVCVLRSSFGIGCAWMLVGSWQAGLQWTVMCSFMMYSKVVVSVCKSRIHWPQCLV